MPLFYYCRKTSTTHRHQARLSVYAHSFYYCGKTSMSLGSKGSSSALASSRPLPSPHAKSGRSPGRPPTGIQRRSTAPRRFCVCNVWHCARPPIRKNGHAGIQLHQSNGLGSNSRLWPMLGEGCPMPQLRTAGVRRRPGSRDGDADARGKGVPSGIPNH